MSQVIKIVPVKDGPAAASASIAQAKPKLVYRGGLLLQSVKVFAVFWGDDWSNGESITSQINSFFKDVVVSPLLDQLSEYSTGSYKIGRGSFLGSIMVPNGGLGSSVSDVDIRRRLLALISSGKAPAPDENTVYFVFLPPDVTVINGRDQSCRNFCGYHDAIDNGVFYAVAPFPGCEGCTNLGQLSVIESLTASCSHELCEAITDQVPGTGWYDDVNGEIGDLCAWNYKMSGSWNVQTEWSNAQNKCV